MPRTLSAAPLSDRVRHSPSLEQVRRLLHRYGGRRPTTGTRRPVRSAARKSS
jgi:hypothetical protein